MGETVIDSGSILTMNLLGIRRVSYIAMALGRGGGGALTAWDYNEDVAGNRSRIMWGKEHIGQDEFSPSVIGGGGWRSWPMRQQYRPRRG